MAHQCTLCLDNLFGYHFPIRAPCGHIFCKAVVVFAGVPELPTEAACPVCGQHFSLLGSQAIVADPKIVYDQDVRTLSGVVARRDAQIAHLEMRLRSSQEMVLHLWAERSATNERIMQLETTFCNGLPKSEAEPIAGLGSLNTKGDASSHAPVLCEETVPARGWSPSGNALPFVPPIKEEPVVPQFSTYEWMKSEDSDSPLLNLLPYGNAPSLQPDAESMNLTPSVSQNTLSQTELSADQFSDRFKRFLAEVPPHEWMTPIQIEPIISMPSDTPYFSCNTCACRSPEPVGSNSDPAAHQDVISVPQAEALSEAQQSMTTSTVPESYHNAYDTSMEG